MAEKKQKKTREKGKQQPAIKWFRERAAENPDADSIAEQAKKEKYSTSTISIQLGRLRGMGLLPAAEKERKEKKGAVRESRPEARKEKETRDHRDQHLTI